MLLAACGREPRSVFVDPAFVTLLPADTTAVLGFRVEQIKTTPAWKQLLASNEFRTRLDEFSRETSFDPRKDLRDLMVAWNGREALVLARGKFSPMGLEPKLERQGVQRLHYRGYPILGDEEKAVLFMNTTTAVAGRTATLRRIVDARDGSKGQAPPMLLERAKPIGRENQVWGVLLGGLNFGTNLPRLTSGLESAWVGVDLSIGVRTVASGLCRTDQDAKVLHDALRALLGIARLTAGNGPPALPRIYDAVVVTKNERVVKVDAHWPPELTLDLAGLFISSQGSRRPN
jgi:hypothetical protein